MISLRPVFFPVKTFSAQSQPLNHTLCPNPTLQYHLQSLVPHSSSSQPFQVSARWLACTAAASCSRRFKVSSESLSIDQDPPNHWPLVTVPTQSLPHTSAVIVPLQRLPRALQGQNPLHSLLLTRRPLVSSYISVTVHSLSLPLGHSSLAVPVSRSPAVTDPLFSPSPRGLHPTISPLKQSRKNRPPPGPHLQCTSLDPCPVGFLPGSRRSVTDKGSQEGCRETPEKGS